MENSCGILESNRYLGHQRIYKLTLIQTGGFTHE